MTEMPQNKPVADHEGAAIAALVTARLDALEAGYSDLPAVPHVPRLEAILAALGGTEGDLALCLTCLAPEFDPRLYARYQAMTGRAWATEWLTSVLFAEPGVPLLTEACMAQRWHLIARQSQVPGEPAALVADTALREWVGGLASIPSALDGVASGVEPLPPLAGWDIEDTARQVSAVLDRGANVVLIVEGTSGAGRATAAACVADALECRSIGLKHAVPGRTWQRTDTVLAHRFAHVSDAVLIWRDTAPEGGLNPPGLRPARFQALTLERGSMPPELHDMVAVHMALPPLGRLERIRMLQDALPHSTNWAEPDRAALLRRRTLTPAAFARLTDCAPDTADKALLTLNDRQEAAMGGLARRVSGAPGWDDIALPEELEDDLRTFAFEASLRASGDAEAGLGPLFAREAGLVSLFAGPPGAGKTMAAQVIASDLGLDLFRVDSGAVVSKYIGETSKNLGQIFERAARVDAVLFFDEADALFAKRTDVKDSRDRHANADTSYLLQLIEGGFDGVAILATNRKTDIDAAFLRRIRYVFDFPRPASAARIRIWLHAAQALDADRARALASLWEPLGQAIDITGAQIKTTLIAAHFAALRAGVQMEAAHILRAIERELAKEGRTLSVRERERIANHA